MLESSRERTKIASDIYINLNLKFIEIIPLHWSEGLTQFYLLPLLAPPETEPPSSFRLIAETEETRPSSTHLLPVTANIKIRPLLCPVHSISYYQFKYWKYNRARAAKVVHEF